MELIEIRNNLIKLSYEENEKPTLGQFIALTGDDKSYVAQYVNLKADNINNFAVAKLMFSFTSDGVVSEYDGSAPSIKSNIVQLPANELLDLLPVETPINLGRISGCPDYFNVDISIFEHNFTVFSENDFEKATLISNCTRQLFRLKEKSIIIDNGSIFGDYPKITLGEDFKLPLNSDLIDFIFDYELKDVDNPTKAVIQDIFYAVQQYIKTLDYEFLPIENFIDVVTTQYKETQMPELALLKNKLLKYRDANIFANDLNDFKELEEKLKEKNCVVINIKDVNDELQKEVINYIHKIVETFDKYVYYFVCLNDYNSDKKLLKRLLNNGHVFTTVFASHKYKYASELKSHAQNIMLFAPQTIEHDFAAYNTFLNKLNPSEGIIYGKLTQGIPLIIAVDDLDLDLTKEDVFGERERFVSAIEEDALSSENIYAINNLQEGLEQTSSEEEEEETTTEQTPISSLYEYQETSDEETENNPEPEETIESQEEETQDISATEIYNDETDTNDESEEIEEIEDDIELDSENNNDEKPEIEQEIVSDSDEDDLSFMDEFESKEETENESENIPDVNADELTEDDLDFIEKENQYTSGYETSSVVPIYNTEEEEENNNENISGINYKTGDRITHPRYGEGTVEKIIKYGNKTLCSIDFDNVGRRLLDPTVSDFEKI